MIALSKIFISLQCRKRQMGPDWCQIFHWSINPIAMPCHKPPPDEQHVQQIAEKCSHDADLHMRSMYGRMENFRPFNGTTVLARSVHNNIRSIWTMFIKVICAFFKEVFLQMGPFFGPHMVSCLRSTNTDFHSKKNAPPQSNKNLSLINSLTVSIRKLRTPVHR